MVRRVIVTSVAAMAIGGVAAAVVAAQSGPPTVSARLGPGSVTLQGAGALAAGPTRFVFTNAGRRGEANPSLVALRPGVTVAQVRALLRRPNAQPGSFKRLVIFQAGGTAPPRGSYTATVSLRPGATYIVVNALDNLARSPLSSFTVGQGPNGATAPAPEATVGVYDYAYGMPATLPRRGVVRFENRGQKLHIGVAFRLRAGASRPAAVRALIRNQEQRFGRLTVERDVVEPLGLVSGGEATDVEVDFPRTGNWVFACFISDGERGNPSHNTLGMVKAFRVVP
jgi:hypothetical protein